MRTAVFTVALLVAVLLAAVPTAPAHAAAGSPQMETSSLQPTAADNVDPELGAATATTSGLANSSATGATTPAIVGLAPNPFADEDAGEYVVLDFPEPTNASGWTLVDDAGAVAELPDRTHQGRTVLSTEPEAVSANTSSSVRPLDGQLPLANGGDSIELRRPDGTVVSAVSYESATEGERYRLHDGEWQWRVPGSTSLDPVETIPASATAFVLPDSPGVVESTLRSAENRVLLGGYTLTSDRVVDALLDAHHRDVDVRVLLEGTQTASELAALFEADRTGPGTTSWEEYSGTVDPVPGGSSTETYPTHFSPEEVPVDRAELLVAPDNARAEVETMLRSAEDSIKIQQMSIEGIDDSLLQASIDAARNGTDVEILLSSASYAQAENSALVEEIDRLAATENLSIDAKLVEPRGRFSKVHAKVAIVDDRHVILGSLNWNPAAYHENREVVLVLTGSEVAAYYADVFEADARNEPLWPLPTGLVAAVCVLWIALALLAIARIRWAV